MRTNFDFTPYRRSTVGFDRLFDLLETEPRGDVAEGYPPFDIVKDGEDSYRVTLARDASAQAGALSQRCRSQSDSASGVGDHDTRWHLSRADSRRDRMTM